jgi:hypothetical protein
MPRSINEIALAEHLVVNSELSHLVQKYLPLDMVTDALCRQVLKACLQAVETKREVMSVISELDNEERDLSRFVAQALATPSTSRVGRCAGQSALSRFAAQALATPTKSDFATREESVKSLILGIRTAALQRRRKEIEKQRQATRVGVGSKVASAEDKKLDVEYTQLGYDIARFKQWDTAVPVMEGM